MNAIGTMVQLKAQPPFFDDLLALGLNACHLDNWDLKLWTDDLADQVKRECNEKKVEVTALWAGVPPPAVWDFLEGPTTLGLVPPQYRTERVAALKRAADFAKRAGLPAMITHIGFIPENPGDPAFGELVAAVRDIALHCRNHGIEFWFETGQETPVTMLRLIQRVDTGNLGINLDPANLVLYGKANPVDALEVFGKFVRNVHAKDGMYPTDPMQLGREVKVGTGRVRFPDLVRRLKEIGFSGAYIIEREIIGDEQKKDILETVAYLRNLLR